ncbi:MAG: ATP synthase F1 subunit delta [Deltaproteobacteria bacterium]|nr:ATP synthase F1 subunit delta [Deltaproteobacteria bacterium]
MTPGAVARRYGRALFELAREASQVEPIGELLAIVAAAVSSLEPGSLAPGLLTLQQRHQLGAALAPTFGHQPLLSRFVGVLAENDRLGQIPAIARTYERLGDAAAGRVRVRVRSASPLTDAELDSIRESLERLTGHVVVPELEIDDDLIGGVTVESQGRVYDGSIRTQLALLERRMAGEV